MAKPDPELSSPRRPLDVPLDLDPIDGSRQMTTNELTADPRDGPLLFRKPSVELQDILSAHRTWLKAGRPEAPGPDQGRRAILSGMDLRHAALGEVSLEGADLSEAHLEGADLRDAHLEGTDLYETHLQGTHLRGAHMEGDLMVNAHMEGSHLRGAFLEGAHLSGAHLEGAQLSGASMEGDLLIGAHLEGAKLSGAQLQGADLHDAHLEGTDQFDTNLEGANLSGARLEAADLNGAFLKGANLQKAYLGGADLRGAHLENADLRSAFLEAADLSGSFLHGANLTNAHLDGAFLREAQAGPIGDEGETAVPAAKFTGACIAGADFTSARLDHADLSDCSCFWAPECDLSMQTARRRFKALKRTEPFRDQESERRLELAEERVRATEKHPATSFEGASLRSANLRSADLSKASLQDANLGEAALDGAKLTDANLAGADFRVERRSRFQLDNNLVHRTRFHAHGWDAWNTLRQTYTYNRIAILTLLSLIVFLPSLMRIIIRGDVGWRLIAAEHSDLGLSALILTSALILYGVLRYWIVWRVQALRLEESRSDYSPQARSYAWLWTVHRWIARPLWCAAVAALALQTWMFLSA